MLRPIQVALCFDENYADYAAVASYSTVRNTLGPVDFHWIYTPDAALKVASLKRALEGKGGSVKTYCVEDTGFESWREMQHLSRAAYLRLLIPDLVDEEKVLYLDCDTLVLQDLSQLFAIELADIDIAGVEVANYVSSVPISDQYLNSGVLLMNLASMRRNDFLLECKRIYSSHQNEIKWADQCIINKFAEGRKLTIPEKFNMGLPRMSRLREDEFEKIVSDPSTVVLHFAGPVKPWQAWCNPKVIDFWQSFVRALGIRVDSIQISDSSQAEILMASLDLNERYKEASMIKTQLIVAYKKQISQLMGANRS